MTQTPASGPFGTGDDPADIVGIDRDAAITSWLGGEPDERHGHTPGNRQPIVIEALTLFMTCTVYDVACRP